MKRFVSILACIAMLLSVTALFAACDNTPDPSSTPAPSTDPSSTPHTHTYTTIWQYDLENHWNECSCGEKGNVAAHADANTDYKCDVCNCDLPQPPHEHSFGTEWKHDEENHWHECDCGEKSSNAAHADADTNGKCDTCDADVPLPPHEHSFGAEWKHDEENHWSECSCGEKSNMAAHIDTDVNAKCDICDAEVPLPPHEHNFGTGWLSNEEKHWQECDCGEKSGEAAHVDSNKDQSCDTCEYRMENSSQGTTSNTLAMGNNAIAKQDVVFTYTATENGTLTLTLTPPASTSLRDVLKVTYSVNGAAAVNLVKNTATDIPMKAGEVITITVTANVDAAINASWKADSAQGSGNTLVMGSNAIAKEDVVFTFTATENGTLTLTLTPPASTSLRDVLKVTYSVNGAAAVNLVKNTATDIPMKAGEVITITVNANVDAAINASWKADSAQGSGNTLVMGSNAIAKEDVVFTFTATENGTLTLTLTPPASTSLRDVLKVTYSVNGAAAVNLVKNTATDIPMKAGEVITITVNANVDAAINASWKAGSSAAPAGDPLPIGTTNMTGEDVTYVYTAPADGVLTLTSNAPFLMTANTYMVTTYSVNGSAAVTLTNGTAAQITLKKGDVVVVTVSTNTKGNLVAAWAASAPAVVNVAAEPKKIA